MVMHFMYSLEFHTKSKREQIRTSAANPHFALHETNSQQGISVGLICLWTMLLDYNTKIVGNLFSVC
jgi:hypothetical protein